MRYRITETCGWVIVGLSGKAENNEPLKVKYLFKRWLSAKDMRVIVSLKDLEEFGVWEMGLLTSFKKEMDQRGGTLRLCHLDPALKGYFHNDRFAERFEFYADLEAAMEGEGNCNDGS
ncbi:MAG TPA: STAS domain-containing protein [Candidatus Binatia bacterium]